MSENAESASFLKIGAGSLEGSTLNYTRFVLPLITSPTSIIGRWRYVISVSVVRIGVIITRACVSWKITVPNIRPISVIPAMNVLSEMIAAANSGRRVSATVPVITTCRGLLAKTQRGQDQGKYDETYQFVAAHNKPPSVFLRLHFIFQALNST